MGNSRYSDSDYTARVDHRRSTGTPTFAYDADIKSGKKKATVADRLKPTNKLRESRDSVSPDGVPQIKIPVIVTLDTTGSMQKVPAIVQSKLPELFGGFLKDKASGKKYLGERGYPDILISAVDDVFAQGVDGAVQVSEFESGLEIDDNITNIWLTGNGGGNWGESYDLMMYFAARHTSHDHWDKRHRKGYMFILGDEPVFSTVSEESVKDVFGDTLKEPLRIEALVKELQKHYHVIWGYPTGHANVYPGQLAGWKKLFGDERVIEFEPEDVCQFIVGCVAAIESGVTAQELQDDGTVNAQLSKALAPLASKAMAHADLDNLPTPTNKSKGVSRL